MRKSLLFALPLVAWLAACGGDGPTTSSATYSATGSWSGSVPTRPGLVLGLTLSQQNANVTGTGNVLVTPVTVTGSVSSPSVVLVLNSPGYQPINFSGQFRTATEIRGTLNGSGFENEEATFKRR